MAYVKNGINHTEQQYFEWLYTVVMWILLKNIKLSFNVELSYLFITNK